MQSKLATASNLDKVRQQASCHPLAGQLVPAEDVQHVLNPADWRPCHSTH